MQELYDALQRADAAGDVEGARQLAQYINSQNAGSVTASARQPAPKIDPTEGMSGADKFLAGAGKAVSDIYFGAKQLGAEGLNKIGLVSDRTVSDLRQEAADTKKLDAPLMQTGAGMGGALAGNLATFMLPLGAAAKGAQVANMGRTAAIANAALNPQTYRSAAAVGAGLGALQPVGTDESRTMNAIIGSAAGLGGQAVIGGASRLAQPVKDRLTDAGRKSVQLLENAGVPLDVAQRSGSPVLGRVRSVLDDNPFTMNAQTALRERQGEAFNAAVLRTIGADAKAATPEVMGAAKSRIGGTMDEILERNAIPYDQALEARLADITKRMTRTIPGKDRGPLLANMDDIIEAAANNDGVIPGRLYQGIKSNLDGISDGASKQIAADIKSAMLNALERSPTARPGDIKALQAARGQWGNMRKIEPAISKDGEGVISPLMLSNSLGTKANRPNSIYGQGNQELADMAKAGRSVLRDKTPNSGTPARLAMGQLLPGAIVGGATGLYTGDPYQALYAAGGVYALPKIAQFALNNQALASYMTNGVQRPAARSLLESPAKIGLLGNAIRRTPIALLEYSN